MLARILLLLLPLIITACDSNPQHLEPSGYIVRAPHSHTSFDTYLRESRQQVRGALQALAFQHSEMPFGPAYPLDAVVVMRSPYEFDTRDRCQSSQQAEGYLLIHGLSDSPYLLSAVARTLAESRPCALIRSVLLPGHGTAPGDSTLVARQEWQAAARYGVESFREQVSSLHIVGYSAGATLAIDYVASHPDDELITGLILLSPALGLPGSTVWLSPYLRWFTRWLGIEGEHDAAKYESFSLHAGAEFYLLIRSLRWQRMPALRIPVLMVASGDDATIDVSAADAFFCSKVSRTGSRLIWYQASAVSRAVPSDCAGTVRVEIADEASRLLSLSHVGITLPASDPHYGLDANYRQCLHYTRDSEQWQRCQFDDQTSVYGERSLLGADGLVDGYQLRRATFNPEFDTMMAQLLCFVDVQCQREQI
jgi:alpha-beta hydrolase superfamily lysophospholipase